MRLKHGTQLLASGLLLGFNAVSAQAALYDRGGGLLYDDVLKVTWLQDANYAKTSGYDDDGKMDWNTANTWAANLVYHDSVRNVDYSDWRLPVTAPANGSSFNYNFADKGSTDVGYNITSPHSEMGYMYYVNLNLKAPTSPSGVEQYDQFGVFGNGFGGFGQTNIGLVSNLQSYHYWTGVEYAPIPNVVWSFAPVDGSQAFLLKSNLVYAWAVRDGDVAAVPVPGAVWLMGAGLIGLIRINRAKGR